ncbi:hypothetical protein GCM10010455_19290 [Microbacterium esteraromaticum]
MLVVIVRPLAVVHEIGEGGCRMLGARDGIGSLLGEHVTTDHPDTLVLDG